jgi:NAD(P)-dependent dehydrogenase (short-subunit alcohol dehydrogenase family)
MTKTVLITGASSGFGKDAAQLFQQHGWNVIAGMRTPQALENVFVTALDVTDTNSIAQAVKAGHDKFGRIDVLVNNAGYGAVGAMEAATEEELRKQYEVNVFGLINMTRAVLPHMRTQKSGVIINISSMGGRITIPFGSLYNSTKFAVEGFTEALQYELNPQGIKTKLIEPGSYRTNFAGRSMNFFGIGSFSDYNDTFEKFTTALKNPNRGNPNIREVSEAIFTAATDDSEQLRYIVGADAATLINFKQEKGDEAFKKMIAGNFGL